MKKVLLGTAAIVAMSGAVYADGHAGVSVGGDGRMGVIDPFGDDGLQFTSRIRISFTATGATDGGLEFGGSVRADNAVGGAAGTAGNVYIQGSFGKLSMGDVDGAAKAAVGHVSGVGLTGLSDTNESTYIANGNDDPTALYEYMSGNLGFYASAGQRETATDEAAIGVTYTFGDIKVALGYEDADLPEHHIILGVTAGFGDATVKAIFGDAGDLGDQMAVSLDYVFGMTTATIFFTDDEELGGAEAYGLGFSNDLGGNASLKGGYAQNETTDEDAFDFGISMKF